MEVNKALIIQVIQKDLKHNQLMSGLRRSGLDTDLHNLELLDVVARLMDIPKGEVTDQWVEVYFSFLEKAFNYPITECGNELLPLADECYDLLLACQKIEQETEEFNEGGKSKA